MYRHQLHLPIDHVIHIVIINANCHKAHIHKNSGTINHTINNNIFIRNNTHNTIVQYDDIKEPH